jgi:hypothetical protein
LNRFAHQNATGSRKKNHNFGGAANMAERNKHRPLKGTCCFEEDHDGHGAFCALPTKISPNFWSANAVAPKHS